MNIPIMLLYCYNVGFRANISRAGRETASEADALPLRKDAMRLPHAASAGYLPPRPRSAATPPIQEGSF